MKALRRHYLGGEEGIGGPVRISGANPLDVGIIEIADELIHSLREDSSEQPMRETKYGQDAAYSDITIVE